MGAPGRHEPPPRWSVVQGLVTVAAMVVLALLLLVAGRSPATTPIPPDTIPPTPRPATTPAVVDPAVEAKIRRARSCTWLLLVYDQADQLVARGHESVLVGYRYKAAAVTRREQLGCAPRWYPSRSG
jgi:hypothetical protein